MRLYILHSAAINADCELSIDCSAPFSSENEAQSMQNAMMRAYMQQFSYPLESWGIEKQGCFSRLACSESQVELQCHIQEMDV